MSKINKKGEIAVKKENIEPPRKKAKFESLICNFVFFLNGIGETKTTIFTAVVVSM